MAMYPTEWNDHPELFDAVWSLLEAGRVAIDNGADPIEGGDEMPDASRSMHRDGYGDEGSLVLRLNGRRFALRLYEVS